MSKKPNASVFAGTKSTASNGCDCFQKVDQRNPVGAGAKTTDLVRYEPLASCLELAPAACNPVNPLEVSNCNAISNCCFTFADRSGVNFPESKVASRALVIPFVSWAKILSISQ